MTKRRLRSFTVKRVLGAYRHRAARVSVFSSIFGKRTRTMLRDVPGALSSLRKMWYARCFALQRVGGCSWLSTRSGMSFSLNCPPFGVCTADTTRRCGHATICPFCFARQRVVAPFRRFEVALYGVSGPYRADQVTQVAKGPAKSLKPLRDDLKLIWFRRYQPLAKPGLEFNLATLSLHLKYVKDSWVSANRKSEFEGFKAVFGFVGFALYPLVRAGKVCLVRYGVLLVPKSVPSSLIATYLNLQPDLRQWAKNKVSGGELNANKRGLYLAFARAVRYPGVMLRGDPEWCVQTLKALTRFRATAFYGKA